MRSLEFYKQPQKLLATASVENKILAKKIIFLIEELRKTPLTHSSKKLIGYKDLYRVRVDKYRIIYSFNQFELKIILIKKRDEVYAELSRIRM